LRSKTLDPPWDEARRKGARDSASDHNFVGRLVYKRVRVLASVFVSAKGIL